MPPRIHCALLLAALAGSAGSPLALADGQNACGPSSDGPCTGCAKAAMWAWRAARLGEAAMNDEAFETPAEALTDTGLLNVALDLEVLPTTSSLSGVCTLTVRSLTANLTQFTFRLRNQYAITSSTINGSTPVTVATASTTTRVATLDRPYNAGETFTLTIAYNGPAVSRGFGSIEFTSQNGQPLISSLSEPYYAYTWWPAKDGDTFLPGDNADKATYQISITAPNTLVSISNGLLQGVDTLPGSRKRYRWSTSYPQSAYLACFSTTNYNSWTRQYTFPGTGAVMPVQFFIYPTDDTPANRAAWEVSLSALDVYGQIYGPYPFANEKYGIYEFPFGGGMEHQTMTGQGTFSENVTVHELAHQWWGDNVTCKTWGDIWLNEGFATYSEALWQERRPGSSGLPALFAAMAARRPSSFAGTVFANDLTSPNSIFNNDTTYRKGGWVLHMVRHVIGDGAFFATLQNYRAAHQGGAATTDDFLSAASAASGQDLTTFFNQWIYNPGAPAYAYGWQPITINGKSYVKVHIRQTQDAGAGVNGLYVMPLDLRVDSSAGSMTRTVRDDALADFFVLPAPAPVTGVALDEFDWVLSTGKTAEPYQAGPPVIVETVPPPFAAFSTQFAPTRVDVYFSEPVNAAPAQFVVTGPSGVVPTSFAYDAAARRVRLTFGAPLSGGSYVVAISGSLTAGATGQALDGDIVGGVLPSGDGAPGGAAAFAFTVVAPPPCQADFNADGHVDPDDLSDFIACYFGTPACPQADFNADGHADPDDLSDFIAVFFAGC